MDRLLTHIETLGSNHAVGTSWADVFSDWTIDIPRGGILLFLTLAIDNTDDTPRQLDIRYDLDASTTTVFSQTINRTGITTLVLPVLLNAPDAGSVLNIQVQAASAGLTLLANESHYVALPAIYQILAGSSEATTTTTTTTTT